MAPATALARLRQEWSANARFRAGVVVILMILVAWAILALGDLRRQWTAAYGEELGRLRRVQSLSGQNVWLQRAEAAKVLRAALEAEIPAANTPGLAQAAVQTRFNEFNAGVNGVLRVQVSAANADTRIAGIWRVPVSIDGDLSLVQAQQLLADIESQPNLMTIETVTLSNRDKVRLTATLFAYYRLPARAAEATHAD